MNSIRKLARLLGVLIVVVASLTSTAHAQAPVAYTWAATALGQACHGGGPLYADGTAGGGTTCSFENGQVIATARPVSWTGPDGGFVTITFNVITIKGPFISWLSPFSFPVTGTPTKVPIGCCEILIMVKPVQ